MLLGFWLVLINSIINTNLKNSYSVLDKYLALAFVIGIFLSQSWGAIFGLIMGISAIFFSKKNKPENFFIHNFVWFCGFIKHTLFSRALLGHIWFLQNCWKV